MRFVHISDLHLGKALNLRDLLEDQEYVLDRVAELVAGGPGCLGGAGSVAIDRGGADALLIAGDIYDRSVPPVQAVALFDSFVRRVMDARPGIRIVAIPGNHDSPGRLGWCSDLLSRAGLHIRTGVPEGPEFAADEGGGRIEVWALPFLETGMFVDIGAASQQDLMARALADIGTRARPDAAKVLVAHCFVTGAATGDSERAFVGNADAVDAALFESFDYVALGHLHRPQVVRARSDESVAGAEIRYSGSPLQYSFGEAGQEKGAFIIDVDPAAPAGSRVRVEFAPIAPLRAVRRLRAPFADFESRRVAGARPDDYIEAFLTDDTTVLGAYERLKVVYPNILSVRQEAFERLAAGGAGSGGAAGSVDGAGVAEGPAPGSVEAVRADFRAFYRTMMDAEVSEGMARAFDRLIAEAGHEADQA